MTSVVRNDNSVRPPNEQPATIRAPGPLLLALLFALPVAHPLLRTFVGVPSHLLWFSHVLPVALMTYRRGQRGAIVSMSLSAFSIAVGERLFGNGYGQSADWETVGALTVALTFTNILIAGFALYARRIESTIQHQAMHDALTGLPNRAYLMELLSMSLARARRTGGEHRFAVLFLDVDQFKRINDSLGHVAGDQLLLDVGKRLAGSVRAVDSVARLGGDEFGILLDGLVDPHDALRTTERIQSQFARPFQIQRHEVVVSASIGVATGHIGYERGEEVLRDADTAMYRAKAGGRGRTQVFDATMHKEAVALLQLETELRRAVDRGELRAEFQPIVRLSDGAVVSFEALMRWTHSTLGAVAPDRFISLAEETGLIDTLGEWMLEEVCRCLCGWNQRGVLPPGFTVHVNLSPRQLQQSRIVAVVEQILGRFEVPGGALGLEITESAVMTDPGRSVERLRALKGLGVHLAVDDFGTGYSSLGYLQRFPIDALKIDRSFVTDMNLGGSNTEIVRAVTALGRELRLLVIAEGVETREQFEILRALGCDLGQGYYFARPVSRRRATALLTRSSRRGAGAPVYVPVQTA